MSFCSYLSYVLIGNLDDVPVYIAYCLTSWHQTAHVATHDEQVLQSVANGTSCSYFLVYVVN